MSSLSASTSPCTAVFSVTIPDGFLSDPVDSAAVALSFVPWVVVFSMLAGLFVKNIRHILYFRAHCASFFLCWLVCDVLKQFIRQPRPVGTCLTTYGMPSAHSSVSIGFAMMVILQWRSPSAFPVVAHLAGENQQHPSNLQDDLSASAFLSSNSAGHQHGKLFWLRVASILVCVMVPWSRVHLMDHSLAQITAGSTVGVFVPFVVFAWFSRKPKS